MAASNKPTDARRAAARRAKEIPTSPSPHTGARAHARSATRRRQKRAIDLDAPPAKRSREEQARLEERVATARSVSSAAVDARVRELMQPAYARFEREEIEAEELTRLKKAAREQATAEDATLSALDKACAEYEAATKAHEAAAKAQEAAATRVAEADAKLDAALRPLEEAAAAKRAGQGAAAGSSGVKAEGAGGDVVR